MLSYESALVFGVAAGVLGPAIGLRTAAGGGSPLAQGRSAAAEAARYFFWPFAALVLMGRVVGHCNDVVGAALWLLIVAPSLLYGVGCGLLAGQFSATRRTRWRRAATASTLFALALAAQGLRLYEMPTARAYSHALGYFAGSLFDEDVAIEPALIALRMLTLLRVLAIGCLLLACSRMARAGAPAWRRGALCVGAWLAAVGLDVGVGPKAGYAVDDGQLQQALPLVRTRPGVVVHLPAGTSVSLAERVADDHGAALETLRAAIPQRDAAPIHSYLFATAQDKAKLMGMAQTQYCKPWKRALFLHGVQAPHPMLAHEMAHAALAPWAPWPLHVPAFGRLWPHLGWIEGMAVAMAPDDTPLGLWATARTMRAEQLGAPLALLFDLAPWRSMRAFWGEAPHRVYLQAGAFCAWLRGEVGEAVLLDAYRDGDLARATGVPVARWVERFDGALQAGAPVERAVRQRVAGQMRQTSLFERRCPHEAARLLRVAQARTGEAKIALLQQWAALADGATERELVVVAAIRAEVARGALSALWGARAGALQARCLQREQSLPAVRVQVLNAQAMAAASAGDWPTVRLAVDEALALPLEADWQRRFEVLQWALALPRPAKSDVFAWLARPEQTEGRHRLARLADDLPPAQAGIARYLLGRHLLQHDDLPAAVPCLQRAGELPTPSLEHERRRLLVLCLWGARRYAEGDDALAAYRLLPLSASERRYAEQVGERLAYSRRRHADVPAPIMH